MASSTQTSQNSSNRIKPTGDNQDIAWQWNILFSLTNRRSVICDFCGKVTNAGITRAKRHQMGKKGDVDPCKKVPEDVKQMLIEAYNKKQTQKEHLTEMEDDDEEEISEISNIRGGKRPMSSSLTSKNTKKVKGPLDLLFYKRPEDTKRSGKDKRQTSMLDACDKEARDRTFQYISRCFCRNGIAFNVVRTKSFQNMLQAIGSYGPNLKPPTYHEMRVPLLKKEVEYTKELMKGHEAERAIYGCSIMSDAWTDKKNRTLINFLVNCSLGSMFVKSVDASSYMKTGEKVFELLDDFVEEIGEKNVVQVISDNGSNYVLAGKLLEAKRKHLFWTPCAAHCIDLMLEDIGKIARVKRTIQRGITLVGFIYNHTLLLSTMRTFTSKSDLIRHGVTRFATSFLTLQRLLAQKNNLRKLFTSEEWSTSKLAKERKGKLATECVLLTTFWNDVVYTLKVMGPLVRVLRLVDNEKKPAMGYIYEAMDKAKEAIQNSFNGVEARYTEVFEIIDRRWECQLHHPLHAAGHYLNPQYYYSDANLDKVGEVMDGLHRGNERLSESPVVVDSIVRELAVYRRAGGMFGNSSAQRLRASLAPADWWRTYGAHTPNLQSFAIRILSLTCSSSGCERNWSIFEHVHSKKRSKLEHEKLQDLVYVKHNQALKERYDCRDVIDPILLNDIDESNEWLIGEMGGGEGNAEDELVFGEDNLTWGDVSRVIQADEPIIYTRKQSRLKKTSTSSSGPSGSKQDKGKGKFTLIDEEFEDIEVGEEEEIYKDGSYGDDEEEDIPLEEDGDDEDEGWDD